MAVKVLENVKMGPTWTSYIAGVGGVLRSCGLWDGEIYKLMGMTGIGFHFIVHSRLCPSSVTVYDWVEEHLSAMDRIGVHTDVYSVPDIRMNTFPRMQEDAISRIKASIDGGRAVVVWAPSRLLEFGIIYGYDDEDGVFFVEECTGNPCDPLLYKNLGKSEVPMLFYQIFKSKVDVDAEKVYRDSLQYAVREWEKEFHINPYYASGRKAYDNMINALQSGNFDEFGLAYNVAVYADAKDCIARYLSCIGETSASLRCIDKAAALYRQTADRFERMTRLFPFSGSNGRGGKTDRSLVPEGLALAKECRALEEEAVAAIKSALEKA